MRQATLRRVVPPEVSSVVMELAPPSSSSTALALGKGQMGSALLDGVTANLVFFARGDLLGTPINLLFSCQKCQGVQFVPVYQNSSLLHRPHECRPHFVHNQGSRGGVVAGAAGARLKQIIRTMK